MALLSRRKSSRKDSQGRRLFFARNHNSPGSHQIRKVDDFIQYRESMRADVTEGNGMNLQLMREYAERPVEEPPAIDETPMVETWPTRFGRERAERLALQVEVNLLRAEKLMPDAPCKTQIELSLSMNGHETPVVATVGYIFTPGEPCVIFDRGQPLEPDSPPEVDLIYVEAFGVNIIKTLLRETLDAIADEILEDYA